MTKFLADGFDMAGGGTVNVEPVIYDNEREDAEPYLFEIHVNGKATGRQFLSSDNPREAYRAAMAYAEGYANAVDAAYAPTQERRAASVLIDEAMSIGKYHAARLSGMSISDGAIKAFATGLLRSGLASVGMDTVGNWAAYGEQMTAAFLTAFYDVAAWLN